MTQPASGRVPNLFIVGAPRCATTSMYSYLREHPDIFLPNSKEPRYFCSDLDSGSRSDGHLFIRDWSQYLELFAEADAEKYVGEGCVFNLFSSVAARRIREVSPDAKIIVMLREPVEQMYSFHAMRLLNGTEDLGFETAIAAEPDRREGRRLPRRARNTKMYQYRAVASYTDQVERYFDTFGRENVRILIYEEFIHNIPAAYRATLEFLGIDSKFQPPFAVVNSNRSNVLPAAARVLRDPALARRGRQLLPTPLRHWAGSIRRRLDAWNMRPTKRAALDSGLRAELNDEFRPEVDRLSLLLGRDLRNVWYRAGPAVPSDPSREPSRGAARGADYEVGSTR
ncbi:MAG: sulfotransferase [Candidatus Limnocylindria bacterium]